jgi:hypothetical protein
MTPINVAGNRFRVLVFIGVYGVHRRLMISLVKEHE